jgi:hypothetical protein
VQALLSTRLIGLLRPRQELRQVWVSSTTTRSKRLWGAASLAWAAPSRADLSRRAIVRLVSRNHDRLARPGVVRQEKPERLAGEHRFVDGRDPVRERVEKRGVHREQRVEEIGQTDAMRLGDQPEERPGAVEAPGAPAGPVAEAGRRARA